jgi:hypothetical protein
MSTIASLPAGPKPAAAALTQPTALFQGYLNPDWRYGRMQLYDLPDDV